MRIGDTLISTDGEGPDPTLPAQQASGDGFPGVLERLGRCAGPCFAVHGSAVHEARKGVSSQPLERIRACIKAAGRIGLGGVR